MTKKCKTCKEEKPVDRFAKNKTSKGGTYNTCKDCINQTNRKKYNKEGEYEKYLKFI